MRILISLSFFLCCLTGIFAQQLSSSAKASLLTLSPGRELYSSFGHSALMVEDSVLGIQKVYNYGTFDFEGEGFYLNFVRGKLDYLLTITTLEDQWLIAQYEDRTLYADELNLDKVQLQRLFDYLEWNARPENRAYKYDFFFDNCSSRIRDVVARACQNELVFNMQVDEKRTYRQLMNQFLGGKEWVALGMNIGLGTPADQLTTYWGQMFLPLYLMKAFEGATLIDNKPLVKKKQILFKGNYSTTQETGIIPFMWFLTLFCAIVCLYFLRNKWILLHDAILFGCTGLLGLVLLLLWVATDHAVCVQNWDLMWASPINLIICFLLYHQNYNRFVIYYLSAYSMLLLVFLVGHYWLPKEVSYAVIPVVALLFFRSITISISYYKSTAHD